MPSPDLDKLIADLLILYDALPSGPLAATRVPDTDHGDECWEAGGFCFDDEQTAKAFAAVLNGIPQIIAALKELQRLKVSHYDLYAISASLTDCVSDSMGGPQ